MPNPDDNTRNYNRGLKFPASYISNNTVTMLGGWQQYASSVQQSSPLSDIGSPWKKVSDSNTIFEGLMYNSNYSSYIAYANAFI